MYRKAALLIVLISLIFTFSVYAQGENLTIRVAVIGPGDELYFWWGHLALVIDDASTGESRFFDYGLFSFQNENFFVNFARGRLWYSSGVSPTDRNLFHYSATNRSVVMYTLDLTPEERLRVLELAEYSVLPENRDYLYHHFDDNCATRVRDIIDIAIGGQLYERFSQEPSRFTLRQHVRRHTWFSPFFDWILNFWMGQVIDTPITVWQDMFLPSEVGKHFYDFWYIDSNGERRRLVSNVETVVEAHGRPVVLDVPRTQWPRQLIFSLVLSLFFGLFFYLQSKNIRAGKIMAGFSMSLCGLILGGAGLLLYFMNFFTYHDYTFQNFNMLFGTPLLLAAVPWGICYAFTKNEEKKFRCGVLLRLLWLLTAFGVVVSMLLKILPSVFQDNLTDQMLVLPISLVFALHPFGLKEANAAVVKFLRRK